MDISTKTISKITFEEIDEIEEQLIECGKNGKPIENIICPRCGKRMIYDERGNSYIITCKTLNCISYGIRGL